MPKNTAFNVPVSESVKEATKNVYYRNQLSSRAELWQKAVQYYIEENPEELEVTEVEKQAFRDL
jgi:metal-responsive CopG/Arc/MetJ family transcriptional regulator